MNSVDAADENIQDETIFQQAVENKESLELLRTGLIKARRQNSGLQAGPAIELAALVSYSSRFRTVNDNDELKPFEKLQYS